MNEPFERGGDDIIDLSGTGIRKIEKCGSGHTQCLILDNNDITRIENVESYGDLKKLSVANNKLVRMYGVFKVVNLRILDLSNNCIVAIEGLRELIHLKWLKLAGNKIKTVEHLNSNVSLEFLDLSSNCISSLVNLSHLKLLRTLLLDSNNIKNLSNAGTYLPDSLVVFGIANNLIADLIQVSFLSSLSNLEQLTFTNNPCLIMTGNAVGFDYRPFIINWCQNLKLLDGFVVGTKESLKAEWLYSMGKGRHFQLGEHAELIDYLASVCPLTTADDLVSEEDAKLNLILSKWHQHQQQLLTESVSEKNVDQRPLTAPSFSDRDSNVATIRTTSNDRSKVPSSSRPCTSLGINSQRHTKEMSRSLSNSWRVTNKQKNNDVSLNKYPVELEVGSLNAGIEDHDYEVSEESFMVASHNVPSDVPESSHDSDLDSEATAAVLALRSESQYVPVPETMLSPDFRPVSASPQCSLFDVGIGSDAQAMTSSLEIRPKWQQRSSIPRAAYSAPPFSPKHSSDGRSNRYIRSSVTDSPLLKRPTQLQRVQKASRPVSLSPSCRRRSPSRTKKSHREDGGSSSSNEDSTDSDISISKLALVKEAVQTKLDAIARKNLRAPEENHSNFTDRDQVAKGSCEEVLDAVPHQNGSKTAEIHSVQDKKCHNNSDLHTVATVIQAAWRGYRTRNYERTCVDVRHEIRVRRAEDHVRVLRDQLTKTRVELERERQLRILQMEAIRALWNEVQQLQASHLHRKDVEHLGPVSGLGSHDLSRSTRPHSDPITDLHLESDPLQKAEVIAEEKSFNGPPSSMTNIEKQERMSYDEAANVKANLHTTCDFLSDHAIPNSILNDAVTKKMISHLIHSCNDLQQQVRQLQEALGIRATPAFPHDLESHFNMMSESAVQNLMHTSSPFVSAVATPVSSETVALPSSSSPLVTSGIMSSTSSLETHILNSSLGDQPTNIISGTSQVEKDNGNVNTNNVEGQI